MGKFKRWKSGEDLVLRADTLNAFTDVAQWYSETRIGGKGGLPAAQREREPDHVWIEASDLTTFAAVLTPTGYAANDPATYQLEASHRPVFTAGAPTSELDAIVIIDRPEVSSETGDPGLARAVVSGRCVVNVLILDESHRYARPEAGNSEYLVSDDFGPAYLLVPPSVAGTTGTEPRPEVVLLGPPQPTVTLRQKRPLDMPCLIPVRDTAGDVVGISGLAQRWVNEDGTVTCETSGVCEGEDCGGLSEPDPDITNPPPFEPPTPPDPPPDNYYIWVSVQECEGFTPTGFPYSVSVAYNPSGGGTVTLSGSVGSGGAWFGPIPWGYDASVSLSYSGGEPVMWGQFAMGSCGGSGSYAFGTSTTVDGSSCDYMSVAFAIGGCPPFVETDLEGVDAPPIDEEEE